ncbi:hypothetical protein ACFTTN_03365 [Streptomyces niveus]|uniref:hypothetical protein n=1 Tax=Streptomyces niveus TaxID=193462 RepID=UPI00362F9EFD
MPTTSSRHRALRLSCTPDEPMRLDIGTLEVLLAPVTATCSRCGHGSGPRRRSRSGIDRPDNELTAACRNTSAPAT